MKKKVLLIEDDDIVRENTAEILELANYLVKTAKNGKIGIELAKAFLPDIILCDIMMPELDGYGVLQILSREPLISKIPFVFLTAKTEYSEVRKGMNLGADDYILKPFQESELLSAIEIRLKRSEAFGFKKEVHDKKSKDEKPIKTLDDILTVSNLISYNADDTIYCEGNNSLYIFLIEKGEVKTHKISAEGKELITGLYKKGDYFGHTSFFNNSQYTETAICITNCNVYRILKDDLLKLIKSNHQFAFDFIELLSENVKEIKEHLLQMAYGSVRKKTAATLLYLVNKSNDKNRLEIKLCRSDMASMAGIAKETLIRTLSDFKSEGLIAASRDIVKILDEEKLQKIL